MPDLRDLRVSHPPGSTTKFKPLWMVQGHENLLRVLRLRVSHLETENPRDGRRVSREGAERRSRLCAKSIWSVLATHTLGREEQMHRARRAHAWARRSICIALAAHMLWSRRAYAVCSERTRLGAKRICVVLGMHTLRREEHPECPSGRTRTSDASTCVVRREPTPGHFDDRRHPPRAQAYAFRAQHMCAARTRVRAARSRNVLQIGQHRPGQSRE